MKNLFLGLFFTAFLSPAIMATNDEPQEITKAKKGVEESIQLCTFMGTRSCIEGLKSKPSGFMDFRGVSLLLLPGAFLYDLAMLGIGTIAVPYAGAKLLYYYVKASFNKQPSPTPEAAGALPKEE